MNDQIPQEPIPEYHHLTDRELLAIITETMIGFDFISDIGDIASEQTAPYDTDVYYPAYVQLRCALTAALERKASDGEGVGE